MPQHKRHHYVPKCYLRPFSLSAGGKAINLYNISASRAIRNAPVKGQCARDYFYGDATDLRLERALQYIENEYARCIHKIEEQPVDVVEDDIVVLREFAFLQFVRTDIAIKRMRMLHSEAEDVLYERASGSRPPAFPSDKQFMHYAMRQYTYLRHYIEDLKGAIIINESTVEFVTSDDPCFFTNRFYLQRLNRSLTFGLASSGVLFFLPLTPRHQFMCYDGKAYIVPEKRGHYVPTDRITDTNALNELQYLKAAENIYFSDWDERERIGRAFRATSQHRPESWHEISVFVPDVLTDTGERYRRATAEERATAKRTMQIMSSRYAEPLHWISKLRHRSPPKVYYDGSAVGYVRKREWLARER